MCLYFDTKRSREFINQKKKENKPLKVYKILYSNGIDISSLHQSQFWSPGAVYESSRTKYKYTTRLTKKELNDHEVNHGFHFFISIYEAKLHQSMPNIQYLSYYYGHNIEIWEFEVQPQDLVAAGNSSCTEGGISQVVAHKAKLIKKVD